MSAEDKFFQSPLPMLVFGKGIADRLEHIISYCVVEIGLKIIRGMDENERSELRKNAKNSKELTNTRDLNHLAAWIGGQKLNVVCGSLDATISRYGKAVEFLSTFGATWGPSPCFRIKAEYVWEVKAGGGMGWRNFATLCGIYAIIGAKDYPVLITRSRILAAAMGYKSPSMLTAGVPRDDSAVPMTTNELRYTLDTLETHGHFARCQPSKRKVYFSNRMSRDEMRKKLYDWKTKRKFVLKTERQCDRALQLKIQATNETGGNQKSPPSHHYNSEANAAIQSPSSNHSVTTNAPPSHHAVTTIIKTPLIETSLKETTHSLARFASVEKSIPKTLSPSERVSFERERDRITERLAVIKGQGSHTTTSIIFSKRQIDEMTKLHERDEELRNLLGAAV